MARRNQPNSNIVPWDYERLKKLLPPHVRLRHDLDFLYLYRGNLSYYYPPLPRLMQVENLRPACNTFINNHKNEFKKQKGAA